MRVADHTHKFKRTRLGNKGHIVYKCTVPDCPTFMAPELVVDRMTICWRCGHEVKMTSKMALQTKPHCIDCTWTHVGAPAHRTEGDAA